MWTTFKMQILSLARTPMLFVWAFAFPIVMATIFSGMFANLEAVDEFDPVRVAVVADDAYASSAFSRVVEKLAEPGEGRLLDVTEVPGVEEARDIISADEASGAFLVDSEGLPTVALSSEASLTTASRAQVDASILRTVADSYRSSEALVSGAVAADPSLLADPGALARSLATSPAVEEVSLVHSDPDQSARYYFALLGMAALMTCNIAMAAVCRMQPNLTSVGARSAVGARSRGGVLLGTLLASWLLTCLCLVAAFAYMRLVLGVEFGGRDGLCVAAVAVVSLFSMALGALVGSVPKAGLGTKSGIITGIAVFASLFAGLYGQPSMELADFVAREFPLVSVANPAKLVTDVFYSLYCYDSLEPFFGKMAILTASAAVLLAISLTVARRQRYEHL